MTRKSLFLLLPFTFQIPCTKYILASYLLPLTPFRILCTWDIFTSHLSPYQTSYFPLLTSHFKRYLPLVDMTRRGLFHHFPFSFHILGTWFIVLRTFLTSYPFQNTMYLVHFHLPPFTLPNFVLPTSHFILRKISPSGRYDKDKSLSPFTFYFPTSYFQLPTSYFSHLSLPNFPLRTTNLSIPIQNPNPRFLQGFVIGRY